MPQYLSPGVYVEEIDAGPKPIEGVSTSVCGAVGMTATGPTSGKPVLVTSFNDFTRIFGGYLPLPNPDILATWKDPDHGAWWQFPLAVRAFFENGGQLLYVKRVVSSQASASTVILGRGWTSSIVRDTPKDADTLWLSHVIGLMPDAKIRIFRGGGGGGDLGAEFTVKAVSDTNSTATLASKVAEPLSAKRGDFVAFQTLSDPVAVPATATLKVIAKAKGNAGDGIRLRIDLMVGNTYNILADPVLAPNPPVITTVKEDTTDGTVTLLSSVGLNAKDHVLIGGVEFAVDTVDAANNAIKLKDAKPTVLKDAQVKQLRRANNHDAVPPPDTLSLWGAATLYPNAIVELSNGQAKETATVVSVVGNAVKLLPAPKNAYFEGHRVRVIEAQVRLQYISVGGVAIDETFANLRLTDDGGPNFLASQVNQRSALAQIAVTDLSGGADLSKFPAASTGTWVNLGQGNDALGSLTIDDFIGEDGGSGKRTGIQALEDIDDISICIVPGMWSPTIHTALTDHCDLLRSRFAILDPPDRLGIEEVRTFRAPINTKYAALYYPWVIGRDPLAAKDVRLAPSAHMAGIYARVDNDRGVHKAPANEPIRGILRIADDVSKREHDRLNPVNINALRFFPDRGYLVYGARCLTSDASWKYINVRRLFIFVEQSIERGTQWVVFEPNDEPLWARVRQSITNFLTTTWRGGALQGGKPAEAFFVKCDRSTMTQDDIDNGRLICLIGIAPVKPAEFVIFRIQQKTLDQTTV